MNCEPIDMDQVDTLIEIRGNYDGWSIAKMKDGRYLNRWTPDSPFYAKAQAVIEGRDD